MTHLSDQIGELRGARPAHGQARAARLAIVVLIAMVALAASPEVSGATASPVDRDGAALAEPGEVVASPIEAGLDEPAGVVATPTEAPVEEQPAPAESPGSGSVEVENTLVIVNRDGSATISGEVTNGTESEVALMDVRVVKAGQALPVSATFMWLSIPPGVPARVGDASDAGGFVVPEGVAAGTPLTVRFLFDSGLCLTKKTDAVTRSAQHSSNYPTSGNRLGPAKQPASSGFENC